MRSERLEQFRNTPLYQIVVLGHGFLRAFLTDSQVSVSMQYTRPSSLCPLQWMVPMAEEG